MPIVHLLAGPNGSGESTFVARILSPVTHLPFVNAVVIAAERWPEDQSAHAEASRAAAEERARLLSEGTSFITETVFSHPSKLELVDVALARGYLVHLNAILLPVDVVVQRVAERVRYDGGHDVPEQKIRERYERLWSLIAQARTRVDRAEFYDNSSATRPFRRVAEYERGVLIGTPAWPAWTPAALTD